MSIITYGLTTLLILKRLNLSSEIDDILTIPFPKKVFYAAALISILLPPLFNKLSGLIAASHTYNDSLSDSQWLELYGFTIMTIGVLKWMILVGLVLYFKRLK